MNPNTPNSGSNETAKGPRAKLPIGIRTAIAPLVMATACASQPAAQVECPESPSKDVQKLSYGKQLLRDFAKKCEARNNCSVPSSKEGCSAECRIKAFDILQNYCSSGRTTGLGDFCSDEEVSSRDEVSEGEKPEESAETEGSRPKRAVIVIDRKEDETNEK